MVVGGRERSGPQIVEADSELGSSAGDDVDCNLNEFAGELPEDSAHDAVGQAAETFGQLSCDLGCPFPSNLTESWASDLRCDN